MAVVEATDATNVSLADDAADADGALFESRLEHYISEVELPTTTTAAKKGPFAVIIAKVKVGMRERARTCFEQSRIRPSRPSDWVSGADASAAVSAARCCGLSRGSHRQLQRPNDASVSICRIRSVWSCGSLG